MTLRDSLGDPANGDDFLDALDERFGVIWNGVILHMTSVGGTANAVTATVTPAVGVGGYQNGMVFSIVWDATNTVSNVTLNGLPVVNADGSALSVGSIESDLASVLVVVDDEFRIISGIGADNTQQSYFFSITTTGSSTFTMPSGLDDDQMVEIECWAGGGGGALTGGAGGGGGYAHKRMRAGDISSSVTVTVGVGGSVGSAGGDTSFGGYLTAYGGAAGTGSLGGGGGGSNEAASGTNGGFQGGGDGGVSVAPDPDVAPGNSSNLWGGGGGAFSGNGGNAVYGGGGGGGDGGSGGASKFGGAGGANGVSGTSPSGGGGTNAAGARGEVRIWIHSGG